ncbi:MAG: hypothetical protein CSA66_01725 [Proteobacteria bacterium]|nr:MAG: hypothetical protein CSA66_01725 [Pseudomonadota bacterium]
MLLKDYALALVPKRLRDSLDAYGEIFTVFAQIRDPKVLRSLAGPAARGLLFKRGKQGVPTSMPASHEAFFDWSYPSDQPEMADLYRRAKQGQWDGEHLPWHLDVDFDDPDVGIFPMDFLDWDHAARLGIKLDADERRRLVMDMGTWSLSQFLHGEQGALYAAAQVTEAVQFMDGKFYGATQVMDEARHVEVFSRYLADKAGKLYQINDNLFTIIDALMTDGRWDMKFLGMQIMVEGLALGAFGTLHQMTREPLLKELLANVIQDEARHVHYGVVALREHISTALTERERREREDWAFEVAMLMRNRFFAYEVYDEWFAHKLSRARWREFIAGSPGMERFRSTMFRRLVPNLREIGLLTDRIKPYYERVGLMRYFGGRAADKVSAAELLSDGESAAGFAAA